MDPKLTFLFYLAAVVCFVLAALGGGGRGRGRGRLGSSLSLVPIGLALWLFPSMWDAFTRAF